ncbi:hypothetical protein C0991_003437 [Blastosporella zonata]|nr:hypothetical protein C0991_003437 [Blastosporella zonata]
MAMRAKLEYRKHSFSDDSDDGGLTPISSPEDVEPLPLAVPHTEAEKARESELLQDPIAIVLSPYLVRCRSCDATIKLSMKSRFDRSHWRSHRTRCLKKHAQRPQKRSKVKAKTHESSDILKLRSPNHPSFKKCSISSRTSSLEEDIKGDSTPELQMYPTRQPPRTPSPLSPMTPLPSPSPKAVFEEYLLRSHGKTGQPFISTRWQDWSWDQLLVPRFVLELDFVPRLKEDFNDDSSANDDGI